MHNKLHQDDALLLFQRFFRMAGSKWNQFLQDFEKAADPEDKAQIFAKDLLKVVSKYNIKLTPKELENLIQSFPGRDVGEDKRINIARLYD